MAIKKICLENFTAFDKIELEFCDGINVLIGENGTGKTHLLKIVYSFCEWVSTESNSYDHNIDDKILQCFQHVPIPRLARKRSNETLLKVELPSDSYEMRYIYITDIIGPSDYAYNRMPSTKPIVTYPSVFIPAKEMLTHSRLEKDYLSRNLPFDITLIDILNKLGVSTVKNLPAEKLATLDKIAQIIGGKIVYKNDRYFVEQPDGTIIDFAVEAEGFKKLGLIYRLIETGYLTKGTVLIWDEPEANINPKNYPFIVEILLELMRDGVQIFIATHDYLFAKYIDVRKNNQHEVRYHALYKKDSSILCEQSSDFEGLQNNAIIEQSISLYKEFGLLK